MVVGVEDLAGDAPAAIASDKGKEIAVGDAKPVSAGELNGGRRTGGAERDHVDFKPRRRPAFVDEGKEFRRRAVDYRAVETTANARVDEETIGNFGAAPLPRRRGVALDQIGDAVGAQ